MFFRRAAAIAVPTQVRFAHLSAYNMFTKHIAKTPALAKQVQVANGYGLQKNVAALYKKLSVAEKAQFAAAGEKIQIKSAGGKSAYTKFVGQQFKTNAAVKNVKGNAQAKIKFIAKLWKAKNKK